VSASPLLMHPKHKLSELLQCQSGAVYQGNYNPNRVGGGCGGVGGGGDRYEKSREGTAGKMRKH